MKKYLQIKLAQLARKIIAKYKPKVIGITGSVGKTSAKEAIFLVVREKYKVRKTEKNFNNEFGLPLTIIGSDSPGRSPLGWLTVFLKAAYQLIFTVDYPKVLVLEMGIDRPGDMDYLLSIVRPEIGVITNIGISHREFFKDSAEIETEKGKLAESLRAQDTLIVNADNEAAYNQRYKTPAHVISYGVQKKAEVSLSNSKEILQLPFSTFLDIQTPTEEISASIRALGTTHLSAVLAAVAVGTALHIESSLIKDGLAEYKPAPGRLNLISGIKKTLIIDDTYNAAPDSMREALQVLKRLPQKYKVAVLGDMRELGEISESAHNEIGALAAKMGLSQLFTVGEGGLMIAKGAREAGFPEDHIFSFTTSDEAKDQVLDTLQAESAILVKGSQAVRLEKVTAEIMAEPMRSTELLPRQYGHWL